MSAGRFTPQFLDEIRARIPVSDVVGRRVKLKRQGREWSGLSPFNAEKTPSFTVNDQKGFYHCFSSGNHGDQFTFVMETEGLSFPEAVERLAGEAGLELPKADPRAIERAKERAPLYDIVEMACAFFEGELRGARGREARETLKTRGMDGETASRFRIGYAPNSRSALKEHLSAKGVTVARMVEAGLVIAGEDIDVPYDRFRDRITFTITDLKGRPISFGARAMGDAKPKYLNGPETELFHKGGTLYNQMTARRAAHDAGRIVCVEGYVDVIACARAGVDEAVAPLGTALTEHQMHLLWRAAPEPVLCFDGDAAGLRAANRAIDVALPHLAPGRSLRFAFLPEGLDPDDLINAQGPDALKAALAETSPMADVLWRREVEGAAADTPERRAALDAKLKALVSRIQDPAVRKHYQDDVRNRLFEHHRAKRDEKRDAGRSARRGDASSFKGGRKGRDDGPTGPSGTLVSHDLKRSGRLSKTALGAAEREAVLFAVPLAHPEIAERYAEEIAEIDVTSPAARRVRDAVLSGEAVGDDPSLGGAAEMLRTVAARLGIPQAEPGSDVRLAEIVWLQALHRHRRAQMQEEVEIARRAFQDDASERSWAWLCRAQEELLRREHEDAELDGISGENKSLDQVIGDVRGRIERHGAKRRRR